MSPPLALLLAGANFAVALGYGAILPLLPALLAMVSTGEPQAADGLNTGGLTGAYMLGVFLTAPAWGWLADRAGRRPVLVVGLLGYAVSLVLVVAARDLVTAYALRAAAGVFAGAVLPVAALLVSQVPDVERRGRLFAAMGGVSLLGFLLGPALSGAIAYLMAGMEGREMSTAVVAWSIGATSAVTAVVAIAAARVRGFDEHESSGAPMHRVPLHWRGLPYAPLAANFLVLFGLGAFEVLVALIGETRLGLDAAGLATLFFECSLVMILVQAALFVSPALVRVPGWAVIGSGFAIMAAGAAWLALERGTLGTMYWGTALIGAASGWLLPAIGFFATIDERRSTGMLLGALTAAASLGQAIGSATGGWMFDGIGSGTFWVVALVLAAGIALAGTRVFRASGRHAPGGAHHQAVGHGP